MTSMIRAAFAACVVLAAAPALAQGVSPTQDLTAVIALQGQPCGQVSSAQKLGENDFLARCTGGQTYRVYVDAQGRTRVEKRG